MRGPNLASGGHPGPAHGSPRRLLAAPDRSCGHPRTPSPAKPAPRSGLSLARSGCPLARTTSPGLSFPACLFDAAPDRPRTRSAAGSPPRDPHRGIWGGSTPAARCPHHLSCALDGGSRLAPRRDFRSLRLNARPDSPFEKLASAHHPISVHSPPAQAGNSGGRINVRGSLCHARLAVPRTSWNQKP